MKNAKLSEKILAGIILILIISLFITPTFITDNSTLNTIRYLTIASIIICVFLLIRSVKNQVKSDVKIVNELIELIDSGKYDEARNIIDINLTNSANNKDVKYKYALLLLELTLGNHDIVKDLLSTTSWMEYERNTYYFYMLMALKDYDIEAAKTYYGFLSNLEIKFPGVYSHQIENGSKILNYVLGGDVQQLTSAYPIVSEVISMDFSEYQNSLEEPVLDSESLI